MTADLLPKLTGLCAGLVLVGGAYLLGAYLEWRRHR